MQESEEFAVSIVRVWKRDGRLQMRVLNRVGLEPGEENTSSLATTDIDEAMRAMRVFIDDFVSS